ncbi:unnamed protein product [Tenebrio molitor]|nr:unnamed protein product [Tenebrio molitor]
MHDALPIFVLSPLTDSGPDRSGCSPRYSPWNPGSGTSGNDLSDSLSRKMERRKSFK